MCFLKKNRLFSAFNIVIFLTIVQGFSEISEKVLVCGVCRNVAPRLDINIHNMEEIGRLFKDYRIIVYENNSIDETSNLLKNWSLSNPKVLVKSEILTDSQLSSCIINKTEDCQFWRPELIARARNIVLDIIMLDQYSDYSVVIMLDMDFKDKINLKAIIEVFENPSHDWDAVFAYQDPYYDWYAFRDPNYPIGAELLRYQAFEYPEVIDNFSKKFKLSPKSDWYPVYSAFGGCGIYKKSSIIGCKYSALVTNDFENLMKIWLLRHHDNYFVLKYKDFISNELLRAIYLPEAKPYLRRIKNPKAGFILNKHKNPIIWRMNNEVFQYPVICEHVAFHASMIMRGHDKLFISPRLYYQRD